MRGSDSQRHLLGSEISVWLRSAFLAAFPDQADVFENVEAVATANPEFGDYQCNAPMSLAKQLRKAPREIAAAAVEHAEKWDAVERLDIAGPGFINISLSSTWLAERLAGMNADPHLGIPKVGEGRTLVMDYGCPNITKPLHIGHLRSHNIGNALDRLHRFLGYTVIADNHLGDWGTQFGITIMGYRHFGNETAMKEQPLEELERVYVESYKRGEQDEQWKVKCRKELVKLQSGDGENHALWEMFIKLSIDEIEKIYARLGISYDLVRGESYYHDQLQPLVDRLKEKGLAVASEGATVVFLEDLGMPVCIVQKSDGAFNYATTDLATVESRITEFSPERIIYVTDERQQLHFRQIFAISGKVGLTTEFVHVWFGLMRLPDKIIQTREGNAIRLEALLDEAESRALDIVKQSSTDMDAEQQTEVARKVGIGAIKYADLSQNPQSVVTFTWEKALALDGNSGPYLQYAYARIASVRDKYAERFPGQDPDLHPLQFVESVERALAIKVAQFPEVVLRAADGYKPNVVADYLFELAQAYSSFYQNVPFLKADEGIRESRVQLCGIIARVLKQGLDLLGIETPERI
jgi:arginyl-tRNA synthetase